MHDTTTNFAGIADFKKGDINLSYRRFNWNNFSTIKTGESERRTELGCRRVLLISCDDFWQK